MLSHNNLSNYYYLIYQWSEQNKYSITEIENMIPFERDIYIGLQRMHREQESRE